jgi:signal transduction histidine kinase
VLEVRDNGGGIGRDREGRPTGKGLASMRRRAKATGGELIIASKLGAGTRVRFTLPLVTEHYISA